MMKGITTFFKVLLIFIASCLTSYFTNYDNNGIINYNSVLTILVTFFSISLTIVAILFTVLDRYKEIVKNKKIFFDYSTIVLKEISDDVKGLLILCILLFLTQILKDFVQLFPILDIPETILIFSIFLSLIIMWDITSSVIKLIIHLKDFDIVNEQPFAEKKESSEQEDSPNEQSATLKQEISDQEQVLLDLYKILSPSSTKELIQYLKTLIIKQQIEEQNKKMKQSKEMKKHNDDIMMNDDLWK